MYLTLCALIFYWCFGSGINAYRQYQKGRLNALNVALYAPLLLGFGALDVLLNYTVFLFMGWPPAGDHTISQRLATYHAGNYGWRTVFASWFCDTLLNPLDPSGNHC